MATPTIATKEFRRWHGPEPKDKTERYISQSRAGNDGQELIGIAQRGDRIQVTTEKDTSNVATLKGQYEALIGTLVSANGVSGDSVSNVFVHDVKVTRVQYHAAAIGGNSIIVTAVWDLEVC